MKSKQINHENSIRELLNRMNTSESMIETNTKNIAIFNETKLDKNIFYDEKKEVHTLLRERKGDMERIENHCTTIENYIDKYLPIRTQFIVSDTLESIIGIKERHRMEKYNTEKFALMYRNILEDTGVPDIGRQIH